MAIFSNQNEVEVVRRLCVEDAQTFVDVIYEARSYIIVSLKGEFTDFHSFRIFFRRWMSLIMHYG